MQRKKGLRMKIQGIELDEEGYITHIYIDYSLLKERGGGILQLADFNRMKFEVDNG